MIRTELEMEFAGAALGWVEHELEMTDPEIGQALGVDRKTIYRWRQRARTSHRIHLARTRPMESVRGVRLPLYLAVARRRAG